jgi:hypothetical protein
MKELGFFGTQCRTTWPSGRKCEQLPFITIPWPFWERVGIPGIFSTMFGQFQKHHDFKWDIPADRPFDLDKNIFCSNSDMTSAEITLYTPSMIENSEKAALYGGVLDRNSGFGIFL